jgi:threonylcarbamoyladenosine tRNA methylthiotransferase MtaB
MALAPRSDSGPADRLPEHRPALERTRAMLKVQDGCDNYCTYCIVPAARGCVSSVPIATVIDDIRRHLDDGFQEVVLTGVALGSYGRDWGQQNALTRLVEAILRETALPRLRLSSIEPENLDHALLDLWSDARLCRHLHLPLQSGCDATLKRMGRRYRSADYAALVQRARSIAPDAAITTDIIAGFPGETDEEFGLSYAFARAMNFARLHVFRFSPRRGTAATRLPGRVTEPDKKSRSAQLLALSDECEQAYRQRFLGATLHVLWEEPWPAPQLPAPDGRLWWTGLSGNYIRVYALSENDMHNRISDVLIQGEIADGLRAQIA